MITYALPSSIGDSYQLNDPEVNEDLVVLTQEETVGGHGRSYHMGGADS